MPSFSVGNGVTDVAPKTVSNNDTGTIAAGGTLAAATAIVALVNKLGLLYQVRHYSRMLEIYSRAEQYLDPGAGGSVTDVAIAVGREALRESGGWVLFRRERGLDVPTSPFRRPSW